MLNDGASPVFGAFFLVVELLVHDVIFESRLLQWILLDYGLGCGAWNLPLLVRMVNFEYLLGCRSPLHLVGLFNGILNFLHLECVIT